jgi:predicted molibdopterin-dependent oxidoreductase YjgC
VNEGKLCVKGWTVHEFVSSFNRLTQPLVRNGASLEESSWQEALDLAAKRLKEIKEKYGSDSIGVLTSAKCTNEENYLLQKFARAAIGTNNVDHCARL